MAVKMLGTVNFSGRDLVRCLVSVKVRLLPVN